MSIDKDTSAIGASAAWSAAALLGTRDWTTRVIATYTGGAGASFSDGTVGGTANPSAVYGASADVMNYLRGDRRKEGTSLRKRNSLMGAVLNAEPVVDRDTGVVYAASGDGTPSTTDKQEIAGTACRYDDSNCKTEKISTGKPIPAAKNSWREIRR